MIRRLQRLRVSLNLPLVLLWLITLPASSLADGTTGTGIAQRAQPASVTLRVSDFGIMQWNRFLKLGADFTHAANRAFGQLSSDAQILVPMFSDKEMKLPEHILQQRIFETLKVRVDQGLAKGVNNFEIQLVEHISRLGYADPFRQKSVDKFGAAAYGAIVELNQYLEAKHITVDNHAIVGSNGTKVFAANLDHWTLNGNAIWDRVEMFDGRAYLEPMQKVITAIGADKIFLFNTLGDLPGPSIPGTPVKSIANFDTNRQLKDQFPELHHYLLSPIDPKLHIWLMGAHVSGMARHHEVYTLQENEGRGRGLTTLPGIVVGETLHDGVIRPKDVYQRASFSPEAEERIAVNRELATHFAEGTLAVGEAIKEIPEWQARFGKLTEGKSAMLGLLESTKDLSAAIQKDFDASGQGHVVWFRTHTFEQIATLLLDKAPQLIYDTWAKGKSDIPLADRARMATYLRQVEGLRELTLTLSHTIMTGQLDKDSRNHLLDGIQALMSVNKGLRAHAVVMDGIQEVLNGVTYEGPGGATSLAAYQHYADAYVNFFWTGVGIRHCGANGACVEATKTLGVSLSHSLGNRLYEFQRAVDNLGNLPIVWGQYETLVDRALASGKEVPTLTEVYGLDLLRELGMDYQTIRESDARVAEMNQKRKASGLIKTDHASPTVTRREAIPLPGPSEGGAASTANSGDRHRGGVITDVVIETEQADLRKKREAVLKAIRPGQLTTELPTRK